MLEELRVQSKSKRRAHYMGNSECSKHRCRQKQRKATVGTKKLTSFFVPIDNSNEDDKEQDTDDNSSEDKEEATLNATWKDSHRLMDVIALLEHQRQKTAQKGEGALHSLR
ncbi:unnamed protein product [Sphagnum troendelagicum]|uniref:Uncharacterized protein n=1 Tax=Sphagnum troendelagicum TaxID=128251 RepID=A0ABP0V318_9BRYO